ncbi:MAG TPA: exodeoxyribonuclease VII small subunit [Candidatus Binataceae bacterium]|nr:exodeoxyribonuclease VII small subunit [Candidatus Binataceae bacterium]
MATTRRKFEDELKDLEGIVGQIDSGELSLEDSIAAFERGVGLVRSLNQKLDEVERKVELLMRNAQGELKTAPYDPAARSEGGGKGDGHRKDTPGKDDDDDIPF